MNGFLEFSSILRVSILEKVKFIGSHTSKMCLTLCNCKAEIRIRIVATLTEWHLSAFCHTISGNVLIAEDIHILLSVLNYSCILL